MLHVSLSVVSTGFSIHEESDPQLTPFVHSMILK